jgi:hypothetical protein
MQEAVFSAVTRLLSRQEPKLVVRVLQLMRVALRSSISCLHTNTKLQEAIVNAVNAFQQNKAVVDSALAVLVVLTCPNSKQQSRLLSPEAVQAVMTSMLLFVDDSKVFKHACKVLSNASLEPSNHELLASKQALACTSHCWRAVLASNPNKTAGSASLDGDLTATCSEALRNLQRATELTA